MSYERMFAEENECDFPGCGEQFDHSQDAFCALIDKPASIGNDASIKAFCKKHCDRLIAEGIVLRSLSVIHTELKEAKEAPRREELRRAQLAREAAFIAGLKKS